MDSRCLKNHLLKLKNFQEFFKRHDTLLMWCVVLCDVWRLNVWWHSTWGVAARHRTVCGGVWWCVGCSLSTWHSTAWWVDAAAQHGTVGSFQLLNVSCHVMVGWRGVAAPLPCYITITCQAPVMLPYVMSHPSCV